MTVSAEHLGNHFSMKATAASYRTVREPGFLNDMDIPAIALAFPCSFIVVPDDRFYNRKPSESPASQIFIFRHVKQRLQTRRHRN